MISLVILIVRLPQIPSTRQQTGSSAKSSITTQHPALISAHLGNYTERLNNSTTQDERIHDQATKHQIYIRCLQIMILIGGGDCREKRWKLRLCSSCHHSLVALNQPPAIGLPLRGLLA